MLQWNEMVVTVMEMMMMIPMKSSSMTMRMAMISPLREGISPADLSLPESFFSLCCFRLVEAAEYFLWLSPRFRVYGDEVREGGASEVGQGHHTWAGRGQGWSRAQGCCGTLLAHLSLPFWLTPSSDKIGTSVFLEIFLELQKYSVLTVLFQASEI